MLQFKIYVFWDVTAFRLVNIYRSFGETASAETLVGVYKSTQLKIPEYLIIFNSTVRKLNLTSVYRAVARIRSDKAILIDDTERCKPTKKTIYLESKIERCFLHGIYLPHVQ
jgi:hypothetical protein